jgi:aspartyl-tRNA(Asn)/glutamyl-tRNA(Gln) amidotransferase subunit A
MLNKLTITQAHQGLVEKKFTAVELTKACLDQIKKMDNKIHAFNTVCGEEALEEAERVDDKIAKGNPSTGSGIISKGNLSTSSGNIRILEGIPIAVKDNICTQGIRTTCSSKMLENFISPYDATVIKKLKQAGAIILGKTNMDEFAMGSSTENSYFGPTRNPHDLERVPGGSSGGSAAAVAANMCIAAIGSDTGGSIRQPASFCGVVGLKPTYGMVSRFGLIAMASSLDQIGVLTKTVEDAEILLDIIKGKDEMDSTSVEPEVTKLRSYEVTKSDLKNLKLGIPKEYFIKGIDSEVEKEVRKGIKKLEKIGAKIIEVSLPHTKYALAVYYLVMPSEVSANLARYDGIRYGYSNVKCQMSNVKCLSDVYFQTRAQGFGDEVKRRIMLGTYSLSAGYYDQYYLKAQKVRSLIKKDFDQVFEKVDLLVTPTAPTPAFKIGEKIDDPIKMYLSDIFTVPVNLAGLPAISVPVTNFQDSSNQSLVASSQLPVGLQIIGKQFDEKLILKVAEAYQQSQN